MTDSADSLGRLMLDLEGASLSAEERELLLHPAVGGVILFTRNFTGRSQLQELVASVRDCNPDLLLAVDQEGGRVQRFRDGFTPLPALHALEPFYEQDSGHARDLAQRCGWLMAAEILHAGLDFSFAPVLDLYSSSSQVIAERAFSADPAVTADLALAYIAGMHEAGMVATGKHFPGHGSVEADSHVELPVDRRSAEEILNRDFQVFARCIHVLDAIMPAHVVYPAVDAQCAGFSRVWLQEKLRQDLEFAGVIFSDDLSMTAAHSLGAIEARLEAALSAGCDMLLVCNDRKAARKSCQWLEQQNLTRSSRLPALSATPADDISNLLNQSRWAEVSAEVAALRADGRSGRE